MKKDELEQNLLFAEKRILELGDRMTALVNENEILQKKNKELENDIEALNDQLSKRLKALSDELYQYIGNQNQQLNTYIDSSKKESDNRISVLSDELYQYNEKQNKELSQEIDNRVSALSSDIYKHIESQNTQLGEYIDSRKNESDVKVSNVSNELYQHIANVNKARDEELQNYKKQLNNELWMRTFGFDNMISELQLAVIEKEFPDNRSRLEALKDTHQGERCFVIGNGPSLTAKDLDKLKEKNIFCFASKGIYNIFENTDWRPDVWGVSDLDYIKVKKDKLDDLDGFTKLVCAQAFIHDGVKIKDAIYYPFIQAERTPKFFNRDVIRGVHFYGTITGKLINFAVYMGFTEIYLLGCDNSLPLKNDKEGKVVIDTSKELHFSDKYYANKTERELAYKNVDNPLGILRYVTDSFKDIKYHCDALNIKIYNATRGGELEVFPRVDFDKVV